MGTRSENARVTPTTVSGYRGFGAGTRGVEPRMSMYTPPSEQHETGAEGGEFIDAEPQDADTSKIGEAMREADQANGEPDVSNAPPKSKTPSKESAADAPR